MLYADPQHALADWRNRWRLERQRLHRDASNAAQAVATASAATKTRLQKLAAAYTAQRQSVEQLLAPLLVGDRGAARETLLGLRTRLPRITARRVTTPTSPAIGCGAKRKTALL